MKRMNQHFLMFILGQMHHQNLHHHRKCILCFMCSTHQLFTQTHKDLLCILTRKSHEHCFPTKLERFVEKYIDFLSKLTFYLLAVVIFSDAVSAFSLDTLKMKKITCWTGHIYLMRLFLDMYAALRSMMHFEN